MHGETNGEPTVDLRRLKQEIETELDRMRGGQATGRPRLRPVPTHQASTSREIQTQALSQLAAMLGKQAGPEATRLRADEASHYASLPLADLADDLGALRRQLDQAPDLRDVCGRLEAIVHRLERELGPPPDARVEQPTSYDVALAELERSRRHGPKFTPDRGVLRVVLEAMPDFHGLMKAYRAIADLPAADSVFVLGFDTDRASLELRLHEPVSAGDVRDWLAESTGEQFVIEEARPDTMRLRLRLVTG
ncbi:MAG: hypothetical protein U1B78_02815 [Dehalococcoidia bacterium]|nr:hypothetical protein [Dehalococcoidia bacterium]